MSLTGAAGAQERNWPAMNAFGRFWGIGWSNGYHAGAYDGRFQHVKDSHPGNMYGSNALLYPYQPGYEPQRPITQASQGYAQPFHANIGEAQQSTPNQNTPTPVPAIPPRPVEPPPTWLRPFLKEDAKGGTELPATREAGDTDETSPSDLLKPKSSPTKPIKEAPAKASDDDDLLTLSPPKSRLERFQAPQNSKSTAQRSTKRLDEIQTAR